MINTVINLFKSKRKRIPCRYTRQEINLLIRYLEGLNLISRPDHFIIENRHLNIKRIKKILRTFSDPSSLALSDPFLHKYAPTFTSKFFNHLWDNATKGAVDRFKTEIDLLYSVMFETTYENLPLLLSCTEQDVNLFNLTPLDEYISKLVKWRLYIDK